LIKLNSVDIAFWNTPDANFVERVIDIWVTYGDSLQFLMLGTGAVIQWVGISTVTPAPMMIPWTPLQ